MPDAVAGLTSIGVATGAQSAASVRPTPTRSPARPSTAIRRIAMYTYAGDANLDGAITGDDYSAIDFNILVPGSSGWYNGDFNYDGAITGDDYSAIDFNILAQGRARSRPAGRPACRASRRCRSRPCWGSARSASWRCAVAAVATSIAVQTILSARDDRPGDHRPAGCHSSPGSGL
jgi:hypothetical protein